MITAMVMTIITTTTTTVMTTTATATSIRLLVQQQQEQQQQGQQAQTVERREQLQQRQQGRCAGSAISAGCSCLTGTWTLWVSFRLICRNKVYHVLSQTLITKVLGMKAAKGQQQASTVPEGTAGVLAVAAGVAAMLAAKVADGAIDFAQQRSQ
jgi:hypothetical protein